MRTGEELVVGGLEFSNGEEVTPLADGTGNAAVIAENEFLACRGGVGCQRLVRTEDLVADVRRGRAAYVEQQAPVVRLGSCLGIGAKALTQPHRDQGAVQPVLEGYADGEIRRQRQRRDDLRSSYSLVACRHVA